MQCLNFSFFLLFSVLTDDKYSSVLDIIGRYHFISIYSDYVNSQEFQGTRAMSESKQTPSAPSNTSSRSRLVPNLRNYWFCFRRQKPGFRNLRRFSCRTTLTFITVFSEAKTKKPLACAGVRGEVLNDYGKWTSKQNRLKQLKEAV